MNHTNTQLKQALAKMLPEKILVVPYKENYEPWIVWKDRKHEGASAYVLDTELLHLCWLVEETLEPTNIYRYKNQLAILIGNELLDRFDYDWALCHATWQQRTIALCKVKGVGLYD